MMAGEECQNTITDGIYIICSDNGLVIDYDYTKYLDYHEGVEKIDKSIRSTNNDKYKSHYERFFSFDDKHFTTYYALVHMLLSDNKVAKNIVFDFAKKIISANVKNKMYLISAFAVKYACVEYKHALDVLTKFVADDENTINRKLSYFISTINNILYKHKIYISAYKDAIASLQLMFAKNLLYQYGLLTQKRAFAITKLVKTKFTSCNTIVAIAIVLLLAEGRNEDARKLYNELYNNTDIKSTSIKITYYNKINHKVRCKELTHKFLRMLLYSKFIKVQNVKLRFG